MGQTKDLTGRLGQAQALQPESPECSVRPCSGRMPQTKDLTGRLRQAQALHLESSRSYVNPAEFLKNPKKRDNRAARVTCRSPFAQDLPDDSDLRHRGWRCKMPAMLRAARAWIEAPPIFHWPDRSFRPDRQQCRKA
jgi:hypothetical protein